MTVLRITVARHDYEIFCDDGQENHLKSLARLLDARMRTLGGELIGKTPDSQLLLLAALTLTDELQDRTRELEQLRNAVLHSSQAFEENKQIEIESKVAATLNHIASRIEAIAEELEGV
jgi:cell division protein ZapA